MHKIQEKLVELSQKHNLKKMGLRQIGRIIGVEHPQKVKYHLKKLGLLDDNKKDAKTGNQPIKSKNMKFVSIPILGLANCGDATILAEAKVEGHLQVSNKMIKNKEDIFAVRAVGSSMNRANIAGNNIEDGDYVIIDSENRFPKDNEYVLSVIDGMANIKKFIDDKRNKQVVLLSESNQYFPPIYIHEDDFSEYLVNGKVIQIIKNPKNNDIEYVPI